MRRSLALLACAAACAPTAPELCAVPGAALDSADLVRADVLAAHPELTPASSVMGCAVFAGATDAVALSAVLRGVEGVQMAELEVLSQPLSLGAPNDPQYERQWHMDTVRAPEAWAMGATGEGVVVAVISVGATTIDDGIARHSNGGRGLDLVAPGGHCERMVFGAPSGEMEDLDGDASPDCVIQETRVEGDMGMGEEVFLHKGMNGTSMASPHVAGAAALLVGMGVPADRVEGILEETAVDIAQDGETNMTGAGRLDAAAAVAQARVELGR